MRTTNLCEFVKLGLFANFSIALCIVTYGVIKNFAAQSNLDYPNPFGQLHNLSVRIGKKFRIIESP